MKKTANEIYIGIVKLYGKYYDPELGLNYLRFFPALKRYLRKELK